MLGLLFENANVFGFEVNFQRCTLNHSSFYKLKMKQAKFLQCSLTEVDFTECELSGASFEASELNGAKFERSNLEKADFRSATGFAINPELNKLKKAKFSGNGLTGLLVHTGIEVLD
jgi:uncharacterized protein YjbI with pentapeptide repeats